MRGSTLITFGVLLIGGTTITGEETQGHGAHMKAVKQAKKTQYPAGGLKDKGTQTTCPVMGSAIDKSVFIDYQGKRIYFCCGSCKAEFEKEPAKYLKILADDGEKPALLALVPQKTCPVMGGAIDRSIYVDYKGKRVYFCCGGCPGQFEKNPEKYLRKLERMGEAPEKL